MAGGVLALLAFGAQGCISGHLLDAARRRERPVTVRAASLVDGRLVLDYVARVEDDRGAFVTRADRRASVAVADVRRGDVPVDAFPVQRLANDGPLRGAAVALEAGSEDPTAISGSCAGRPLPSLLLERGEDGRDVRFVLCEDGTAPSPPFETSALSATRTAPWVYPLLPASAAFDLAVLPLHVVVWPVLILVGD